MGTATVVPTKSMQPFLTIAAGQFISMLGSGLTNFALAVWIFNETGQATPFALTVLFGTLPAILLSPLAGSLADGLLNPLMAAGGKLGSGWVGALLGSGPGRGIGLGYVTCGLALIVISLWVYANPRIRNLEDEIPDAVAT